MGNTHAFGNTNTTNVFGNTNVSHTPAFGNTNTTNVFGNANVSNTQAFGNQTPKSETARSQAPTPSQDFKFSVPLSNDSTISASDVNTSFSEQSTISQFNSVGEVPRTVNLMDFVIGSKWIIDGL